MLRFRRRKLNKATREVDKLVDVARPALKDASPVSADVHAHKGVKLEVAVKPGNLRPGRLARAVERTKKIARSRVARLLTRAALAAAKKYVVYRHRLKARRLRKKGVPL